MGEEWITTNEAAEILGIALNSAGNLLREGRLKGRKFGRFWMVSKASVMEYAASYRKPGPKPRKTKEELDK